MRLWGLGKFLGYDSPYGTWPDDILTLTVSPDETRRGIRQQSTYAGDNLAQLRKAAIEAFVQRMDTW